MLFSMDMGMGVGVGVGMGMVAIILQYWHVNGLNGEMSLLEAHLPLDNSAFGPPTKNHLTSSTRSVAKESGATKFNLFNLILSFVDLAISFDRCERIGT